MNLTNRSRRDMLAGLAVATGAMTSGRAFARPATSTSTLTATSPGGRIKVELHLPDPSYPFPRWSAKFDDKPIIEASRLALVLGNGRLLGPGAQLESFDTLPVDASWSPPYGIADEYDGKASQIEARFLDRKSGIRFAVRLIAHADGVAYRFALLSARNAKVTLGGEDCELRFPSGTNIWSSRDEGEYVQSAPGKIAPPPHPELTNSTDKGPLADTPLLALTQQGLALSVCESDRLHYPRLMFAPGPDLQSVSTYLMRFPGRATGYSGPGETHAAPIFAVEPPFTTPWRLIMVAQEPVKLLEKSGLVTTLATPNQLGDTSWIRPGRAFRIRKPYTNERAMEGIAFAARRKLDYIEFDAHWYGDGTDPSDATRPIDGLDMAAIISKASAAGLGTILYVDRVPAMKQRDAILLTYQKWGVAGIKFGFIWEGRQEDVDFIHDLVRACGEHRLLVNLHDNLRPAGLERTLPNYLALEGVRGNEQFPTARHNVSLPFTRALSGPIDYTICYDHYKNLTTNAHQLAMAAVYYNPLTFLYWYDEPSKYATGSWPALAWFDSCPTSWDETSALSGKPGEHIVVARRSGPRWFLGAMTNEEARHLRVSTAFLKQGAWKLTLYADGNPASLARNTPVIISEKQIEAGAIIDLHLAPSGGQAILFEPLA